MRYLLFFLMKVSGGCDDRPLLLAALRGRHGKILPNFSSHLSRGIFYVFSAQALSRR